MLDAFLSNSFIQVLINMESTPRSVSNTFSHVPGIETAGVLLLEERYQADSHPGKISLNTGAYRDDQGSRFLLPSIDQAARDLVSSSCFSHEYLGLQGHQSFLRGAQRVAFGPAVDHNRVASIQSIGGTGACHMGAAFLKRWFRSDAVAYVSDPSWENHHDIFSHEGITTTTYPYWDKDTKSICVSNMMRAIEDAPTGSIIVLHACGHNPTGQDLSTAQWEELAHIMSQRGHFAYFDSAYQGFVSGYLEEDNRSVKIFASLDIPMLVAQSFSKNAGLYGERLGALHIRCHNPATAGRIVQQLKYIARREISSPGRYPAEIMARVFDDPVLLSAWGTDLKTMSNRLTKMRVELVRRLTDLGVPGDWSHIVSQRGMFAYTGLTSKQCETMTNQLHIYFPPTGRFSIAGLNPDNIDTVARGIAQVVGPASI